MAITATHSYFIHSSTRLHLGWLRYVIGDNRFHRLHHSHRSHRRLRRLNCVLVLPHTYQHHLDLQHPNLDFPMYLMFHVVLDLHLCRELMATHLDQNCQ